MRHCTEITTRAQNARKQSIPTRDYVPKYHNKEAKSLYDLSIKLKAKDIKS